LTSRRPKLTKMKTVNFIFYQKKKKKKKKKRKKKKKKTKKKIHFKFERKIQTRRSGAPGGQRGVLKQFGSPLEECDSHIFQILETVPKAHSLVSSSKAMDVPKDQIAMLLEHGLYSSAQMLVNSHSPTNFTQNLFRLRASNFVCFYLIDVFVWWKGCFLVSSPAANAETSPHLKAESLVRISNSISLSYSDIRVLLFQF
jgi:hypothetical protein